VVGGGGTSFQNYRQDGQLFQIGASALHVPSGLFVYGLYQNDQEDGTQYRSLNLNNGKLGGAAANESDTWFVKAGIKRTFSPVGATVLWGEWGQYNDMYRGLCGAPPSGAFNSATICATSVATGVVNSGYYKGEAITTDALITGSEVTRYGVGVVQEIDSAAMHLFARWQHLDLDLSAKNLGVDCVGQAGDQTCVGNGKFGKNLNTSWEGLDIFQIGGVIFF
jgi:hypothetical protein